MSNEKQRDMIHGPLAWNIFLFAMPLAASSILQQLFNSADVAVVGHFAGSNALAAVGSNGAVIALFVNIFAGLSVGANVVIANLIGQKKEEEIPDVVHTTMCFALLCGIVLVFAGAVIARPVLELIGTPENVLELAVQYLQIYFIGMPFIILYNFGAAILRSIGDTKRPMYSLILAGILNVLLNLLLVIVFRLGVAGVAISTTVSNAVSAGIVIYILTHEKSSIRLDFRRLTLKKRYLRKVIQVGAPASLQSAIFSFSNVFIQAGINSFGADAVAGSSTGLNFEYFTYFMCSAFAQAAVTFASQNFGAGELARCRKITRIAMLEGMGLTALLSIIFTVGGPLLVQFYTSDEAVIRFALSRMLHIMSLECLTGLYEISGSVLRGIGYSMLPALLTVLGSVCFRVFWMYTIFEKWHSYSVLMTVYPVSWILTAAMMLSAYFIITKKVLG